MPSASLLYSDFVKTPTKGIAALDESGEVLLRRRDGDDVVLRYAATADEDRAGVVLLSDLFRRVMDKDLTERLVVAMREQLPWISLLPSEYQRQCAAELVELAQASAAVGHYHLLQAHVAAWEAAADAYARGVPADGVDLEWLNEPELVPDPRS